MSLKWVKLGDVVEVIRGASPRPKGDPRYFGGDIPWIMIADVTKQPGKYLSKTREGVTPEGANKSRLLKAGTLILSNSGTVCVPKILAVEGCIHDGFVAFPDLPATIDKDYLYHYFNFIRPRIIQENKQGITQVNLNTNIVKDIDFPLRPLEDQQKIVSEIETQLSRLDEAVTALKRIQANLKRYKAAVLKAAVEGKLTEQWRKDHPDIEPADQLLKRILAERRAKWETEELAKMKAKGIKPKDDSWKKKYKEPAGPDTANLPELPEGWVWVRLGALQVDVFDGPFGSNLKSTDYVSNGVRVIRLENIGSREFIDGKESFVTEQKYEQLKKHTVGHGDIIFSSFVANETRVVMLPGHIKKAINKADCFCVRINYEAINKLYIETFLATRTAYEQLVGEVHGATRPRINTTQLKDCHVSMPALAEQNEIVSELDRRLSVTEELEATIETNLKRAERLRQTLLQQAFSGIPVQN